MTLQEILLRQEDYVSRPILGNKDPVFDNFKVSQSETYNWSTPHKWMRTTKPKAFLVAYLARPNTTEFQNEDTSKQAHAGNAF